MIKDTRYYEKEYSDILGILTNSPLKTEKVDCK